MLDAGYTMQDERFFPDYFINKELIE